MNCLGRSGTRSLDMTNTVIRCDPDLTGVLVATVQQTMGLQQIVVTKKPSSVAF